LGRDSQPLVFTTDTGIENSGRHVYSYAKLLPGNIFPTVCSLRSKCPHFSTR